MAFVSVRAETKINKIKKQQDLGCTIAIIPFTNIKYSLQENKSDCSVCIADICYSGPRLAVSIKKLLLKEKKACAKL